MTMHKALHPRDDIERLYVSKKEEDSIQNSEDCIKMRWGRLIKAIRNNTDNNN